MGIDPSPDLLQASTPLLKRAADLLDRVSEVFADESRWCRGAYAKDAEGEPIEGPILEAVERSEVASRCVLGELLHQGLARGYRIELETTDTPDGQIAHDIPRAPAGWMVAALALDLAVRSSNEQHTRRADALRAKYPPRRPITPGQVVLRTTVFNDNHSYEDAIRCVALAAQMLRAELDRRAQE